MVDQKPMTDAELREAVQGLIQLEEERAERARRRARRRQRRKERETEAGLARLAQSIEIIKWCVVSISSVMAVGLIVGIMVIMELEREAERIKGEVTAIQRQAEGIRDKIQNPLSTLGETLGARLEDRLSELVRGGSEDE